MISLLNPNTTSNRSNENDCDDNNIMTSQQQPQPQQPNPKYERHSFPQTSSPNDITQHWLNEQLAKTLDNLTLVEIKLDSMTTNQHEGRELQVVQEQVQGGDRFEELKKLNLPNHY